MPRVAVQNMDYALSLRSATSIVDCGTDCIGTGDVTVMGWIKNYTLGPSGISNRIVHNGQFIFGELKTGGFVVSSNAGVTYFVTPNTSTPLNTWLHAAVTRKSSGLATVYIMSATSGTPNSNSGTPAAAAANMYMGNLTVSRNIDGLLKNWAIVPRICTQAEIQAHMNGTTPTDAVRVYKMNEGTGSTMLDSSSNAVNGTITSGTWTTDTPSKVRVAASSRRSVQDMHCSLSTGTAGNVRGDTGLPLTLTDFSVGTWISMGKSQLRSYPHLFSLGLFDEFCLWADFTSATNPTGRIVMKTTGISGGTIDIPTSGYVRNHFGRFFPVVATYNGTLLTVTLNGVQVYQTTRVGTVTLSNDKLTLANDGTLSGNNSDAKYKHTFVCPRALTAQEIADYSNSFKMPAGSNVMWSLDEGAGQIAYDSSGNGNNGTITSGTWSADVPSKKRGVVGGNMVPNGDMSFVPRVNAPQTSGYAWLDGTSSGSGSNSLFCFAMFNYTSSYAAKFDTTEKYNGNNSLKLSTTGVASTIGVGTNLGDAGSHAKNNIPCLPNTSYTMTFYMKTNLVSGSAATGVLGRIVMCTGSGIGSAGASIAVGGVTTTTDWTKYTATILTSATARFLKTEFSIVGNDGAATLIMDAWFADIQLRPTVASGRETVV